MSSPKERAGATAANSPARGLLVAYYVLLALVAAGLVVGAKAVVTGELASLLPKLLGWKLCLPIAGWCGTALAVYGLWRWRWWGFVLGLSAAAFELTIELYGGGLGWHLLRLPVTAGLLTWLCLTLRGRFRPNVGQPRRLPSEADAELGSRPPTS